MHAFACRTFVSAQCLLYRWRLCGARKIHLLTVVVEYTTHAMTLLLTAVGAARLLHFSVTRDAPAVRQHSMRIHISIWLSP